MDKAKEEGNKDDADEISLNEDQDDSNKDDADEISLNEDQDDSNKDDADEISLNEDQDDSNKDDADEISLNEDQDDSNKDDADEISLNEDQDDSNKDDADEISPNEDQDDSNKDDADEISPNEDQDDSNKDDADEISLNEDQDDSNKDDADEISLNEDQDDSNKDDADEISLNEDQDDSNKDDADEISLNLGLSIQCYEDGHYEEAIRNGKKCLQMATENGNRYAEMNACLVIGESELKCKEYEKFILHSTRLMEIVINNGFKEVDMKECSAYGETVFSFGLYDKELKYGWWSDNIAVKPCEAETNSALGEYEDIISYCMRAVNIAKEIGDQHAEMKSCLVIAKAYRALRNYDKAIDYSWRCIDIANETADKHVEMEACLFLTETYKISGDCKNTIQCALMLHDLAKETDDKKNEMEACFVLMKNYQSLKQYKEAVQYAKMYLEVAKETGDKRGDLEMRTCFFIAHTQLEARNYTEAFKYGIMYADVAKEIGDKRSEIFACAIIFRSASRISESYDEIIQYATKRIEHETDDHGNKKIGYLLLGLVDDDLEKYEDAVSYFRKALFHAKAEGDEYGEMIICNCLRVKYILLNQLDDAISFCERSFQIAKKIGDKNREMEGSVRLSELYGLLNRNDEVKSHATDALEVAKEIGDKECQKYTNLLLGDLYRRSNQESKAIACLTECIDVSRETGDVYAEVLASSLNLPSMDCLLKLFIEGPEAVDSALSEYAQGYLCSFYLLQLHDLLTFSVSLCMIFEASYGREIWQLISLDRQFFLESLEIWINNQPWTAEEKEKIRKFLQIYFANIFDGSLLSKFESFLDNYMDVGSKALAHCCIGMVYYLTGLISNVKASCQTAIRCFESLFDSLHHHDVDTSKISIADRYVNTYKLLSKILIEEGNTEEALSVAERCRAKALNDILVLEYGLTKKVVQESHFKVNEIFPVLKTHKFSILFYTVFLNELHKFVMKDGNGLHFSVQFLDSLDLRLKKPIKEVYEELEVQPAFRCETVSWHSPVAACLKCDDFKGMITNFILEEMAPDQTIGWDMEHFELKDAVDPAINFFLSLSGNLENTETVSSCNDATGGESSSTSPLEALSKTLLGNVSLDREQDEVVIIPDGLLSIVPFAALTNPATGHYLSEDKKIRFAPSLSTLKVLSESREDFHTLKGAIFIGDPDVSKVLYNGKPVGQLKNARTEVTAIARNFNVTPLIGEKATKDSVLEKLKEGASVVHIAAHGNLDKATILLAPGPNVRGVPEEKDYMLTMADIQATQLRPQLVVLSCCYSGRGEIRTEGVVGMCRAFLASGARAVVASLWAIDDEATLEFMLEFYDRLEHGESASTSLQMAMKWLRDIYKEPKYWAPFFLMGDDVNITF